MAARYTPLMTVREAKEVLREHAVEGDTCPVCLQRVQIYKRKVTASQLRTMGLLYWQQIRQPRDDPWVYLPSIPQHSRDFATLAYFGLVEQKPGKREDGGAAGWWRISTRGICFMRNAESIVKYAQVYNGRVLGFEGPTVWAEDVAPEFRLDELMAGA